MNNQIRKLYNEAVQYTMANAGRKGQASCNRLCANKFAELIVVECGDWIVNNAGAMEHLGPLHFAKAMQKDFGVK
jgi:hypothetical protein